MHPSLDAWEPTFSGPVAGDVGTRIICGPTPARRQSPYRGRVTSQAYAARDVTVDTLVGDRIVTAGSLRRAHGRPARPAPTRAGQRPLDGRALSIDPHVLHALHDRRSVHLLRTDESPKSCPIYGIGAWCRRRRGARDCLKGQFSAANRIRPSEVGGQGQVEVSARRGTDDDRVAADIVAADLQMRQCASSLALNVRTRLANERCSAGSQRSEASNAGWLGLRLPRQRERVHLLAEPSGRRTDAACLDSGSRRSDLVHQEFIITGAGRLSDGVAKAAAGSASRCRTRSAAGACSSLGGRAPEDQGQAHRAVRDDARRDQVSFSLLAALAGVASRCTRSGTGGVAQVVSRTSDVMRRLR